MARINVELKVGRTTLATVIPTIILSVEAARGFHALQNFNSKEFGTFGLGQVNIAIKSGSNTWHGSASELLRNDRLDAKDFFDLANRDKPAF
ncbi:MAG: hypothetical protein QXI60_02215 [Thermofilaceae archaeon]